MEKLETTGLSKEEIIQAYRYVLLGRRLDERVWQLTRIGKTTFNISGQGHEVGQVAMALNFNHENDYFLPYYRDMAAVLAWGMKPYEVLAATFAKADDPNSHGRQMPNHYGDKALNIVSHSSPVSTQYPDATGVAYGAILGNENYVTVVTTGDGSSNQGEVQEAMNFAGIHKLPLIFVIENNEYTISVPQKQQYAAKELADRAKGYGFEGHRVNGSDFAETYNAFKDAVEKVHEGNGPVLIEMMVERLTSHSSDDDQSVYRSKEELEELKKKDPLDVMRKQMISEGYLTESEEEDLNKEVQAEVDEATTKAENMADPTLESLFEDVYAE